jgi:hypothetical protein
MSDLYANRNIIRVAILALLIVSLLGPWAYDLIHVPAEFPCEYPVVRLYGDFCGMPMSWVSGFLLFAGDFFSILWALVSGTFTGRGRELLGVVLLALPILPLFSTLFLLRKKDSPRLRRLHLIALGLGCVFPLFILFSQQKVNILLLWGPWLYLIVAVGMFILDFILLKRKTDET